MLAGLPGLAPAVWALMALRSDRSDENDPITQAGGASALKLFKALELIVEMMPQSVLQCVRRSAAPTAPCTELISAPV